MTGASRADWLRYRALWFSLLNQGFKRAGTANSDSHSLSNERIGYPRNLVWGGHDQGTFDFDSFDADVRAGHLEGTNGPVIDVTIDDGATKIYRPDMAPITVSATATLKISVAAAPWIPVTEARVFVNGALVHTFDLSSLFPSGDPFGTRVSSGTVSLQLATLLPAKGDAWLVVEAGLHQDTPARHRRRRSARSAGRGPARAAPARAIPGSICKPSRPASGRRRSAIRSSSTSTAAVGRRRACSEADPTPRRCSAAFCRAPRARRAPSCAGVACPGRFEAAAGPLAGGTAGRTAGRLRRRAGCLPGLRSLAPPARRALRRKRGARLRGAHHRQRDRARAAADQRAERDLDRPRPHHLPLRQRRRAGRQRRPRSGRRRSVITWCWPPAPGRPSRPTLRALLPIDTARQSGIETGLELGASGRARLSRRWLADGGLSLAAPLVVTGGQAHAQLQPAALAEVWFAPRTAFALFARRQPPDGGRADVLAGQRHPTRRHAVGAGARPVDGVSGRSPGGGGRPHQRHRQPVFGLDP